MKITIKNLKQVTFVVEVPSAESTVLDLKKEIEKSQNFDAEQMKLLFLGVILDNNKKLADYKIEEGATIILMMSKVKVKNNPQQQPDQKVNPQSNEEKKEEKQEQKQEEKQEQKQEEKKPEQKPQESDENKYAAQIASLIDMGFEKSQAEAAIKAARGQINLAVDYLYSGIPEGVNDNEPQLGEGEPEGEDGGDDDPVKRTASIAKIICQNDPTKLTNLLQNLQQNDPDLFSLINEREEEFKNLLEQPVNENDIRNLRSFERQMGMGGEQGGEGHGHGHGQGTITVNLTPEDRVVINRLKELGNFNEADVIQAYIACDKNEEMTANYLFEHMMDDGNNNGH